MDINDNSTRQNKIIQLQKKKSIMMKTRAPASNKPSKMRKANQSETRIRCPRFSTDSEGEGDEEKKRRSLDDTDRETKV